MEVDSAGEAQSVAEEPAAAGEARPAGTWAEIAARAAPTAAAPKDPFVDAMLAPSLTTTENDAATFAVRLHATHNLATQRASFTKHMCVCMQTLRGADQHYTACSQDCAVLTRSNSATCNAHAGPS